MSLEGNFYKKENESIGDQTWLKKHEIDEPVYRKNNNVPRKCLSNEEMIKQFYDEFIKMKKFRDAKSKLSATTEGLFSKYYKQIVEMDISPEEKLIMIDKIHTIFSDWIDFKIAELEEENNNKKL